MNASRTPGTLKRFRRTTWKFQQTFQTPLKRLGPFVATIISSSLQPLRGGSLTIDSVIFEPEHLLAVLASHRLPPQPARDTTLTAVGTEETAELLQAALADWIDLLFVPQPRPFVIYADHDEYITFFAQTKSNLNRVVEPLRRAGFEAVEYRRDL